MSLSKQDLENAVKRAVADALNAERSQVASQRSQEGEQHHSAESLDDCPTCRKAYKMDEFKAKTIQKDWNERKGLHMKCKKCKFPVKTESDGYTKETQDVTCPNCNSSEAEDRYVWE